MPKNDFYILGKNLGVNKKDIDTILEKRTVSDKSVSFLLGADSYIKGTTYGSISVKDF